MPRVPSLPTTAPTRSYPGRPARGRAELDDVLTVGQHELQGQDVIGRGAVLEGVGTAGVLGDVAPDGAGRLARGIGRVEQTVPPPPPSRQVRVHHTGLDDGDSDPRRSPRRFDSCGSTRSRPRPALATAPPESPVPGSSRHEAGTPEACDRPTRRRRTSSVRCGGAPPLRGACRVFSVSAVALVDEKLLPAGCRQARLPDDGLASASTSRRHGRGIVSQSGPPVAGSGESEALEVFLAQPQVVARPRAAR